MSVSTTTTEVTYNGTGATPMAVPFAFFRADDLVVTVDDLAVDFTLTGDPRTGSASVTLTVPLATAQDIRIRRLVALTQPSSFGVAGKFSPKSHEETFDRLAMQIQDLDADLGRAVDGTLPPPALAQSVLTAGRSALAAAASEEAAATSAAEAAASHTIAAIATATAQAARDAAAVAGKIFADTTAGLAGTTNGQYFAVPDSTNENFLDLYLNSTGSAVWVASSVGTANFDAGFTPDYTAGFVDEIGRVALGVRDDGTIDMGDMTAENADVTDLTVTRINGELVSATTRTPGEYDYELGHILTYGQSLSRGSFGEIWTDTQRHNSVKFVAGVRADDGGTTPAVIYASLVPLIETTSGGGLGETPTGGTCESLLDLIEAEDGLAYDAHSFQLLGSAPGEGGKTIAQLSKGTSYYNRLLENVTYAKTRAAALNQTYGVLAVTWAQGEWDILNATPAATYKALLDQLVADLNTDIKAITGQTKSIPLIVYQTASHLAYASDAKIANAQFEVAVSNPLVMLAVPGYIFAHAGDYIHLNGRGYKSMGAFYGRAIKRAVVDGEKWEPVRPISHVTQGKVINLTFNVPRGPLVLDTTLVAINTNYGFELVDSGGSPLTISSVELLGDNRVKIVAAAIVPAGAKVRYGWSGTAGRSGPTQGARGNLRDSQGDVLVFTSGALSLPLHNWCPIFEYGV